jgi:hypothetical protein
MLFKANKEGHMPEEKLKKQMNKIFKTNGIDMPMEVLEFSNKISNVFLRFIREGHFCDECKRKLYEATEKE